MLFPFRSSAIFRNRWVALLWAVGICFMASEIVDSISGITGKQDGRQAAAPATSPAAGQDEDQVAAVLTGTPPETSRIVR